MKRIYLFYILGFLVCTPFLGIAQKSIIGKADLEYNNLNYAKAVSGYLDAYSSDSTNMYVVKKIAQSYFNMSEYALALAYYQKLISSEKYESEDLFHLAQLLKIDGKQEEAKKYLKIYASSKPEDKRVQMELNDFDANLEVDKTIASYKIWNLPLNTNYIDMSPACFRDQLVFASSGNIINSNKTVSGFNNQPFLELYSTTKDGDTKNIKIFSKKINTKFHEGPVCFSKDGNTMYFTRNNFHGVTFKQQEAKVNNLKIFIAKWDGTDWSDITEFPYNSDKYSVGHAALSQDEQTLYFSSNMPGGYGGTDIYCSKLVNGEWAEPVNMGHSINTEGKEMFPYVDSNGVLYFSSNGIPGLGGLDIFAAYNNPDGSWRIVNPGKPLNSSYDDFGYIINDLDCSGFFTSNRPGGKGYDDIYGFKIEAADLSVRCFNSKTQKVLPFTRVILKADDGDIISSTVSDEIGFAHFFVEPCMNYIVSAQKENYLSDSRQVSFNVNSIEFSQNLELSLQRVTPQLKISVVDQSDGTKISGASLQFIIEDKTENVVCSNGTFVLDIPDKESIEFFASSNGYFGKTKVFLPEKGNNELSELSIELERIQLGKKIILDNIYYDLNKWEIRPDAALELNKVVKILNDNPEIRIELSSHTDCRASNLYNDRLSQHRADSAVEYLVKQGISRNRLVAKGYGETQLLNKCADGIYCTEEEHQINRRTELKVLE